jgi:hypothetical protein
MDRHPKQRGFIEVDAIYPSRQTDREFGLSLMAVWTFKFEAENAPEFINPFEPLEISVEAENWADASGLAAGDFMLRIPRPQDFDFTYVTANLIAVEY